MSIGVGVPNLKDTGLYEVLRKITQKAVDGTRSPLFVDETNSRVGVRNTSPATSAALDIGGTTGALLIPRLTTTQKNALTAVNGMVCYDSTLNKFQGYENGAWTNLI